jgi:hypothetical protein
LGPYFNVFQPLFQDLLVIFLINLPSPIPQPVFKEGIFARPLFLSRYFQVDKKSIFQYNITMKRFKWNELKNVQLQERRGISKATKKYLKNGG